MIKVFIPRYRTIEEDHGKSHTVFDIDVYVSGKHHKLEKRYRAFHLLHKQLKKTVITPEFPPKRVRNWNPKILEQRRQSLETYIQTLIKHNPVPVLLLLFLNIPVPKETSTFTSEDDWKKSPIMHQPILTFTKDPFVDVTTTGNLPDIIEQGVTIGLFSQNALPI